MLKVKEEAIVEPKKPSNPLEYRELIDIVKAKYPFFNSISITKMPQNYGWGHNEYNVNISSNRKLDTPIDCLHPIYGSKNSLSSIGLYINFYIRSMYTGCGSAIFHGWTGLGYIPESSKLKEAGLLENVEKEYTKIVKDVFNIILKDLKTSGSRGPGVLITTAGDTFWTGTGYKFITEELGFKVVDEYQNHQHGKGCKQRLLSLHI